MVQELPISKQNELKWINSLWPKEKSSIDPKAVTGTDEFDIWGLSKIHSDQDGNIFVSGGVQVWCYWPDYNFRRHILLEAGEVILLKVRATRTSKISVSKSKNPKKSVGRAG